MTREQQIADLWDLFNFIEAHPDLPVGNHGPGNHCVTGVDDEAGMKELHRIADILCTVVTANPEATHHGTSRPFGTVSYRAFYVSRASMKRYYEDLAWLREKRAEQAGGGGQL